MIEIRNLTVSYKSNNNYIKALNNINLKTTEKSIYAIIGPSGCGKSTLLKVLAGIITNNEGEVFLNEEKLNPHYHRIGLIPQNFGLLPWKTVRENLLLPFKIKREKITKEIIKKLELVTKRLDIYKLLDRSPHQLSGGEKQRVSIARSFIMKPDLLLMDEAFSALDAIIREEAQMLFLDLWNTEKISTFFVTHNIDEALLMGERILVMSNGPSEIVKIIDNPLFNNVDYKKNQLYSELFEEIKGLIPRRNNKIE